MPVMMEEERDLVVSAILDHQQVPIMRKRQGRKRPVPGKFKVTAYYVKWADPNVLPSWEPVENVDNCDQLIQQYHASKGMNTDGNTYVIGFMCPGIWA
jgi:hypothetical protein